MPDDDIFDDDDALDIVLLKEDRQSGSRHEGRRGVITDLHSCRKDTIMMIIMTPFDIISLITISKATHAYHNHH